jgi:hypothetical protein
MNHVIPVPILVQYRLADPPEWFSSNSHAPYTQLQEPVDN